MSVNGKYQLFSPLSPEEYAALEADIKKRGVQIPVEKDEEGNTLDGHHRQEIADRLGIACPEVTRHFASEAEKREHVLKINLARRHLDPLRWGLAFALLLEERGIERGRGKVNQHTVASATVAEAASELGVPERTARHRLALADAYQALPESLRTEVDAGSKNVFQARREADRKRRQAEAPLPAVASNDPRWSVEEADCLEWFAARPVDFVDGVFFSPPFEDARLYLEGGVDLGIARGTDKWVAWMVEVYRAALRCCTGLVAGIVAGRTRNYSWSAAPALLMAALVRAGITLRNPLIYRRHGTPGSGGPDWLRSDYEWIVCATRGGPLPWSDNTALGHPPRRTGQTRFGNKPSRATGKCGEAGEHRTYFNGNGYGSSTERKNRGSHRAQRDAGCVVQPPVRVNPGNVVGYATCGHKNGDTVSDCRYVVPEMVNPGNVVDPGDVIDCGSVGGGKMGDDLCHDNEAPFPEALAEFLIRSFCPPGGIVCDPFSGSGTTAAVALKLGRRFAGCDLRKSQVELTKQRIARVLQSEDDAAPTW
jgi:hypothetical protein